MQSPFIRNSDIPIEDLGQGLRRQILGYDSKLMLVKVFFEKDAIGPPHAHPHQQVSLILQGSFEVTIDDQKRVLHEGDSFVVKGSLTHSVLCLSEGVLLDAFSPMREDFVKTN